MQPGAGGTRCWVRRAACHTRPGRCAQHACRALTASLPPPILGRGESADGEGENVLRVFGMRPPGAEMAWPMPLLREVEQLPRRQGRGAAGACGQGQKRKIGAPHSPVVDRDAAGHADGHRHRRDEQGARRRPDARLVGARGGGARNRQVDPHAPARRARGNPGPEPVRLGRGIPGAAADAGRQARRLLRAHRGPRGNRADGDHAGARAGEARPPHRRLHPDPVHAGGQCPPRHGRADQGLHPGARRMGAASRARG